MKIVGKNVTRSEARLIESYVRTAIRILRRRVHEINMPAGAADAAVKALVVKRSGRGTCFGGADVITINLRYGEMMQWQYTEYASFDKDPVIGRIQTGCIENVWMAVTAHEVAHHVQFAHGPYTPRFKSTYRKPHGQAFKDIYRILRREWVNPAIAEWHKNNS